MTLYDKIVEAYPQLTSEDFSPFTGCISLRDDTDGFGPYIQKWEYNKPIPDGLTLGKPSA